MDIEQSQSEESSNRKLEKKTDQDTRQSQGYEEYLKKVMHET